MKSFQFTIGPVQGFVAQSRRTRDLLASSFLLSYLCGHAMVAVLRQEDESEIVFPYVKKEGEGKHFNQPLLDAIYHLPSEEGPWMGTLPNRFKAIVPNDFDPEKCVRAVEVAWKRVTSAVWNVVEGVTDQGEKTKMIWDRQVDHFWEINWVMGQEEDLLDQEGDLLDRRKVWRSFVPTIEHGDKCTLMPHLQELSGYYRSKRQRDFWKQMRSEMERKGWSYVLGEDERLSAIALIKRLFPLVAQEALGWKFPKEAKYFPSTSHIAALPWIIKAVHSNSEEMKAFGKLAEEMGIQKSGSLKQLVKSSTQGLPDHATKLFMELDARVFYRNEWKRLEEEKGKNINLDHFNATYERLLEKMNGEPQPYYALLFMDGDGLGSLLQKAQKGETKYTDQQISQAVSQFANQVADCVKAHHGVTIYAGGDDVMALLTKDDALSAAVDLRQRYMEVFREINQNHPNPVATISGAIVYTHYLTHLQNVLQYGRNLLDQVAKEKTGRDSLAVGVWKRSGPVLKWATPWDGLVKRDSPEFSTPIDDLVRKFREESSDQVSHSFLYKLRETYEASPSFEEDHNENKKTMTDLILADYLRIKGDETRVNPLEWKAEIEKLLKLCFRSWRDEKGDVHLAEGKFSADGAFFVQFLAKEREEER